MPEWTCLDLHPQLCVDFERLLADYNRLHAEYESNSKLIDGSNGDVRKGPGGDRLQEAAAECDRLRQELANALQVQQSAQEASEKLRSDTEKERRQWEQDKQSLSNNAVRLGEELADERKQRLQLEQRLLQGPSVNTPSSAAPRPLKLSALEDQVRHLEDQNLHVWTEKRDREKEVKQLKQEVKNLKEELKKYRGT